MDLLTRACRILANWARVSGGEPIELSPTVTYSFRTKKRYTHAELDAFDSRASFALPAEYRQFLCDTGAGDYFVNTHGLGLVVRGPEELREWSGRVFVGRQDPYP